MASLDDFIKMVSSLGELQRQKDMVQRQVEDAQHLLVRVTQESEQKARSLVTEAQAQASTIIQAVQEKQKELAQREADVTTREQAVAWVDAKVKELNEQEQSLSQAQAATETARTEARAQQQFWSEKLKELNVKEEALTQLAEAAEAKR